MRRRITVKDSSKIKATKSKITFNIGDRPYNVPGQNIHVQGDEILIPEKVFDRASLWKLEPDSFDVGDLENPIYFDKARNSFCEWNRKFHYRNKTFYIFGFDQEPKIVIDSKYGAIIAAEDDDYLDRIYTRLDYEFRNIEGVLSLMHYTFIGDAYKTIHDKELLHKAENYLPQFEEKMRKYLPELFVVWKEKPQPEDYEQEFDYWIAESSYKTSAKSTFIVCCSNDNNRS